MIGVERALRRSGRLSVKVATPSDQDKIERTNRVDRVQFGNCLQEPFVSLRSRSSALDTKSIALAHNMNIREVNHAPLSIALRVGGEGEQIPRLGHCRICDAPSKSREGKIDTDDDDRVCKCDRYEKVQGREVSETPYPARSRPCRCGQPERNCADQQGRHRGTGSSGRIPSGCGNAAGKELF